MRQNLTGVRSRDDRTVKIPRLKGPPPLISLKGREFNFQTPIGALVLLILSVP